MIQTSTKTCFQTDLTAAMQAFPPKFLVFTDFGRIAQKSTETHRLPKISSPGN